MPQGGGCITSTAEGGRWCEIDLRPGSVIAYGPGPDHAGMDPVGLGLAFAIAQLDELESVADELELDLAAPARGQVHALVPSHDTGGLADALSVLFDDPAVGIADPKRKEDDNLYATVRARAEGSRQRRVGGGGRIDNRHLTRTCVEYADTIGRAPTIRELCVVAHVSERRLRGAFTAIFAMPPTRFFRFWALSAAYRRLKNAAPRGASVAGVAVEHGFAHFGRFSAMYRHLYGENPSVTLRRSNSR